jgi:hypothetical protein
MKYKIYTLEHPITGEIRYVGFTSEKYIKTRLIQHIHQARYNKSKTYSSNWIKLLLKQELRPIIKLLDETNDNWQDLEKYWIAQFKAWGFRLTNISKGGDKTRLGLKNSEEVINNFNKSVCQYDIYGSYLNTFKSATEAEKITGVHRTGIHHSIKHKANAGNFQWRFNDNTKNNISPLSKSSYIRSTIYQYNLNGDFIKEWKGPKEVEKNLKIKSANITKVLRNQRKTAGNFIWKYSITSNIITPQKQKGERKVILIENDKEIKFNNSRELAKYCQVSFQLISLFLLGKIKSSKKLKNKIIKYE